MNNLITNSVKKFLEINSLNNEVYKYLNFYEELRDLKEVDLIYNKLQNWLEKNLKIKSLKISIFSKHEHEKEIVYQNSSDEKYLELSLCKQYKIDINNDLYIIFYLMCENKKHLDEINSKDTYLNTLFYMTAPFITTISYQELVKELTFKDPLTSVYNRKFLVEHFNKLLPLSKREKKNISFLMIGIDHFKAVIDEFDYDIGDKVLVNLSKILEDNIRESDLLVRLDSDEFLLTLVGITNQEDAKLVAQKLIDNFALSSVKVNEKGYVIKKTICIGITHFDYECKSIDDILKNADISLYEAKNLGRGKIHEFIPGQNECIDLF